MSSSILYENSSATITILDIPRSIELAQGSARSQRLISSKPLEHPYLSVEPKSAKAKAAIGATPLEDLLLRKHLEFALDEVKVEYKGPWYLPRSTDDIAAVAEMLPENNDANRLAGTTRDDVRDETNHVHLAKDCSFFHNSKPEYVNVVLPNGAKGFIPPNSTSIGGDISATLSLFVENAPKFDIILLDPPWPNRSARRKNSYSISYGNSDIRTLLSSIPLYEHLADDGYVAVWITNKPSIREMVVGEGGLFEEWGVQLTEEWIWLKVTSNGEPIFPLDSTWRKAYEVLLVGRRGGGHAKKRVILAVPDLHSRKPNLKSLLEKMAGVEYSSCLEIFARSLTAGCWSWGNEVLKFQNAEHWVI
ncbi:Methyltransferase 4 [Hyphodiscus hymeniophilus]|uniref:Methyltransferase 4 n=1 Tax=Hyphodiscus hymeniophilus TaxID=353542 RepID=A0A9P7AZP1_9HELO|nr:Methyltransferase 4 [Hyphodiscus hymeniophilus]